MKHPALLLLATTLVSCAGKIKNKPADMPGSPEEAEQMQQDNTVDKAPPDPENPDPTPDDGGIE